MSEVNADGQDTSAEETPVVNQMSKEELNAFLNGEEAEAEPEAGEASGEEGEEKAEGSDEGAEGDESTDDDGQKDTKEADDASETIKALEERIEQQSKLLDKFGTEVGLLRKKSPEDEKASLEAIRDLYLEDPVEGHKAMMEHFRNEEAAVAQSREAEMTQILDRNRSAVSPFKGEFENETNISEIVELIKEDGASAETIEAFKESPYVMEGSTLFALHKRNEAVKKLTAVEADLVKANETIAELKKKPGEVLDKIADATKIKTLTGKDGSSSSVTTSQDSNKPVTRLTQAELKAILKK